MTQIILRTPDVKEKIKEAEEKREELSARIAKTRALLWFPGRDEEVARLEESRDQADEWIMSLKRKVA